MSKLSKNIRTLREQKELTQADIATYLEMSRIGYSKYERGEAEPSVITLIKIADLYNISLDELVGREREVESEQLRIIQRHKEIKEQVKEVAESVVREFLSEYEEEIIKRINSNI